MFVASTTCDTASTTAVALGFLPVALFATARLTGAFLKLALSALSCQ